MSLIDILDLDCRYEDDARILQETLHKIKPFKKIDGDIPMIKLERLVKVISDKYKYHVGHINGDPWANDETIIWSAMIVNQANLKSDTVYGTTLYEVMAKSCIRLWDLVQRSKKK